MLAIYVWITVLEDVWISVSKLLWSIINAWLASQQTGREIFQQESKEPGNHSKGYGVIKMLMKY